MANLDIIGLNYCVLIDRKVMHKKAMGFANLERQVPMTQDKLFAVASMSKLFSSTALTSAIVTRFNIETKYNAKPNPYLNSKCF